MLENDFVVVFSFCGRSTHALAFQTSWALHASLPFFHLSEGLVALESKDREYNPDTPVAFGWHMVDVWLSQQRGYEALPPVRTSQEQTMNTFKSAPRELYRGVL